MKKAPPAAVLASVLLLFLSLPAPAAAKGMSGKALFKKNCAGCHFSGGNVINPAYTLHKKDLRKHGVKTAEDIVRIMRRPGPGMHAFSKQMVPDAQAGKIARYILRTFK